MSICKKNLCVLQFFSLMPGPSGVKTFFLGSICLSTGIEPPDPQKEKDGIAALQMKERKVDHCVSCFKINLSSHAYSCACVVPFPTPTLPAWVIPLGVGGRGVG